MEQEAKNRFKKIFIENWIEFQVHNTRYDTDYYDKVINKMLGCGDPENGFMSFCCKNCGERKKIPFSCKSSFCLSCARVYTDNWVEYISKALFTGMRYRHVVLTMPDILRKWFYRDSELLSDLMKTGYSFYEEVVGIWMKEAVKVGCIVVLQTAGRNGSWNPHLHIISTSGGITEEGKWRGYGYIKFELLHIKWKKRLLDMLEEKAEKKEMIDDIRKCREKYPKGFVSYIEKGDVPEGGSGLAGYLAKYVVSPPISLRRILKYDGEKVRYWYRDHKTRKREEDEVGVMTFIGRMAQHILPKGFQRIRYYGLHAICTAKKTRGKIEEQLKIETEKSGGKYKNTYQVTGYRERIKRYFGIDPFKCEKCGEVMELEGIWHPEYGWVVDRRDEFLEDTG